MTLKNNIGANYFGFFNGIFGIAEATRLNAKALTESGVTLSYKNFSYPNFERDEALHEYNDDKYDFPINIFHINIDIFNEFFINNPQIELKNKYNIAYWAWEFDVIPEESLKLLNYMDEIWVPSTFCVDIFTPAVKIPVIKILHPIEILDKNNSFQKNEYNIPKDNFLYLISFDSSSTFERKNPIDTIKAFKEATKSINNVTLIVKTHNLERNKLVQNAIEEVTNQSSNILVINEKFSKEKLHSLFQQIDVLLSLHASEGFGLSMAEAMAYGKITIATGYSGNIDFMNINNSLLVKYKMSEISEDSGFIKKGYKIAKPDILHATELIKYTYENGNEMEILKANAKTTVATLLSLQNIGTLMAKRLNFINSDFINKSETNSILLDNFTYENEILRLNKRIKYLEKSFYNKIRKSINKLLKKIKKKKS